MSADDDQACAAAGSGGSSECSSTGKSNDAGSVPQTIEELQAAMQKAAADLNFEKAAELRDQIQKLKKVGQPAKEAGRHSEKPTPKPLDNDNIYERNYEEL